MKVGSLLFGISFSKDQASVLNNEKYPQWNLNPPQREEYEDDKSYALGLREYADKLIAQNQKK